MTEILKKLLIKNIDRHINIQMTTMQGQAFQGQNIFSIFYNVKICPFTAFYVIFTLLYQLYICPIGSDNNS